MLGINLEDIQIKTSRFAKEESCASKLISDEVKTETDLTETEPTEKEPTEKWPVAMYKDDNDDFISEKVSTVVEFERQLDLNDILDESTGKYHCNECDYETQMLQKIGQHMKTRHERRYKCEHCEYASKSKSHVQLHMVSKHTGVRYDCDKCNFQTAYKENVERHRASKHAHDKKNKKYKCDMCDFKTYVERYLKTHKRKAHDKYIKEVYYKMAQLKKESKEC